MITLNSTSFHLPNVTVIYKMWKIVIRKVMTSQMVACSLLLFRGSNSFNKSEMLSGWFA